MQKIHPCLWFDNQAEQAMNFYVSVFRNAKVGKVLRHGDAGPGEKGSVLTCTFEIEGQQFTALNGGPHFKINEAISFVVDCKSQQEVDELWDKLTADGGQPSHCAWLKDKFGVSWQVVPKPLIDMMTDPDAAKAARATQAMFQMKKIDIATVRRAAG